MLHAQGRKVLRVTLAAHAPADTPIAVHEIVGLGFQA